MNTNPINNRPQGAAGYVRWIFSPPPTGLDPGAELHGTQQKLKYALFALVFCSAILLGLSLNILFPHLIPPTLILAVSLIGVVCFGYTAISGVKSIQRASAVEEGPQIEMQIL